MLLLIENIIEDSSASHFEHRQHVSYFRPNKAIEALTILFTRYQQLAQLNIIIQKSNLEIMSFTSGRIVT